MSLIKAPCVKLGRARESAMTFCIITEPTLSMENICRLLFVLLKAVEENSWSHLLFKHGMRGWVLGQPTKDGESSN
jgi:hypothetical protein